VSRESGRGPKGPRPGTAQSRGPLRPSELLAAFFLPALVFLVAGAGAALVNLIWGPEWARWLALHLVLLGGVSQLVIGAAQFFAAAFLATDPPPRRLVAAQVVTWNAGVLLVAAGRPLAMPGLTSLGGLLVVGGLALFASGLLEMRRRSLQSNQWAVRWYITSAVCLGAGAVLGILLAEGRSGDFTALLGAHLTLNLLGWLGGAVVGTLHTFFPSLTGTKLSRPRLEPATFVAWYSGVALLALGLALEWQMLTALGWAALLAAASLLGLNLIGCLRQRAAPVGLPVRLVGSGQAFLAAGLCVGLASALASGGENPLYGSYGAALAALLVSGWLGFTVAGSLLHLFALLARVRSGFAAGMPAPKPVRDLLIAAVAAVGVALLALSAVPALDFAAPAGRLLVVAPAVAVAAMIIRSAVRAISPGRSRAPSALAP
jgi:nitrite reductase (NO-forming)